MNKRKTNIRITNMEYKNKNLPEIRTLCNSLINSNMNIVEQILIELKQSIDNLMHETRDTDLIDCDKFNKLFGKKQ